jgi:maleylpyruvate isomerase
MLFSVQLVGNTMKTLPEEFKREINPLEQVPVLEVTSLVDGSVDRFAQSVAIIEYLEEAFPGTTKLYPENLKQRALARQIAEIVNSGIQPLQSLSLLRQVKNVELIAGADGESKPGNARDFASDAIVRGFVAIEALLPAATSGLFAAGTPVPTIADIFLVPQVYNANRFGIDLTPYPKINAIVEKCKDIESFKRAAPEAQPDASA